MSPPLCTRRYLVIRTALADPSSLIGNSRSGYIEPPSPLLGLTSIRAGLRPVTTFERRRERPERLRATTHTANRAALSQTADRSSTSSAYHFWSFLVL